MAAMQWKYHLHIDGLVQDCNISSALDLQCASNGDTVAL